MWTEHPQIRYTLLHGYFFEDSSFEDAFFKADFLEISIQGGGFQCYGVNRKFWAQNIRQSTGISLL